MVELTAYRLEDSIATYTPINKTIAHQRRNSAIGNKSNVLLHLIFLRLSSRDVYASAASLGLS